jgi:hypothetical protein
MKSAVFIHSKSENYEVGGAVNSSTPPKRGHLVNTPIKQISHE